MVNRRYRWTVNLAGTVGLAAVVLMGVCRKSPETMAHRMAALTASEPRCGWADATRSTGNIAEATFTWTFTVETGTVQLTGMKVALPCDATHFHLDILYPGGYIASADGTVHIVTVTPTITVIPTRTATPCVETLWGRVGPYGRCYNCAGAMTAGVAVGGFGTVCVAPPTPTRTAMPPTPTRTPRHPIVVPFRPTLSGAGMKAVEKRERGATGRS